MTRTLRPRRAPMASAGSRRAPTKDGGKRYRVEYRLGGREATTRYGGSFKTKRLANDREGVDPRRTAALRVPDVRLLDAEAEAPTLAEAAERGAPRAIDVVERTANMHRPRSRGSSRSPRSCATGASTRSTVDDVAGLVAALAAARLQARDDPEDPRPRSRRRSTSSGSTRTPPVTAREAAEGAQGTHPAAARRARRARRRGAAAPVRAALLVIDECGPRVSELETAQVGDLDEHRRAIRVRWTVEKNERYRHLDLPDDLFAALVAMLPPREDRDLDAPLFPDLTDARLRTAITKACKATGTPHFSPHGLRRRRGSLLLQAHRLARRGGRTARRLEAGRRRPLHVRAHGLPRGRPNDRARPRPRLKAATPCRPPCRPRRREHGPCRQVRFRPGAQQSGSRPTDQRDDDRNRSASLWRQGSW